jgi:hypothetical protein
MVHPSLAKRLIVDIVDGLANQVIITILYELAGQAGKKPTVNRLASLLFDPSYTGRPD